RRPGRRRVPRTRHGDRRASHGAAEAALDRTASRTEARASALLASTGVLRTGGHVNALPLLILRPRRQRSSKIGTCSVLSAGGFGVARLRGGERPGTPVTAPALSILIRHKHRWA